MASGGAEHGMEAVAAIVLEVLRLGWPQKWVAKTLSALPRRHRGEIFDEARRLGNRLRQADPFAMLLPALQEHDWGA
eukprot:15476293-Alexandrium_andersonii.AAC.1